MKTYNAFILYEDGTTQKVEEIHTIQHFDQSIITTTVEDYIENHLTLGNVIGLFGDHQSLNIRKGKYRSIYFSQD